MIVTILLIFVGSALAWYSYCAFRVFFKYDSKPYLMLSSILMVMALSLMFGPDTMLRNVTLLILSAILLSNPLHDSLHQEDANKRINKPEIFWSLGLKK
jgi:fatty acid desaturase